LRVIGPSAFYQTALFTICIPTSVEIIGNDCFSWSRSLAELRFEHPSKLAAIPASFTVLTSVETISVPASVNSIAAICGLVQMKSISLEEGSVFRIEDELILHPRGDLVLGFGNNVVISVPKFVKVICGGAFAWRVTIREVFVPPSIENIQALAFSNCWELVSVHFDGDSQLRTIGSIAFIACRRLPLFEIPKLVETIGTGCFADCSQLTVVTFKGEFGIKRIETKAFFTSRLGRVCIPASVEMIGRWAFPQNCQINFPWPFASAEFAQWKEAHAQAFENLFPKGI
jgi:hypothetical protein